MNIQLHLLTPAERERFVNGFCAAARFDFPDFDPDLDMVRPAPWSRPWESEPVTLIYPDSVPPALAQLQQAAARTGLNTCALLPRPTPERLGRDWFWIVLPEMRKEAALQG